MSLKDYVQVWKRRFPFERIAKVAVRAHSAEDAT
jgi:hypothetical protein